MTGESFGSTAMAWNEGLRFFDRLRIAARNSPTSAHGCDQDIHLAIRILPDLSAAVVLAVNIRVGGVVKLLRNPGECGVSFANCSALAMAPFMPSVPGRQDEPSLRA
jgi:hypothetical protein